MFRRRRAAGEVDPTDEVEREADVDDTEGDAPAGVPASPARPQGPWDSTDAPGDERPRIDLGSLLVPVPDGMEVRVDMQDQTVVAATLVDGHSAMQIHAFAAPKSSGIWGEVRGEIAESIRQSGGTAEDAAGPLGPELRARVPAQNPDGTVAAGMGQQPLRFIGVDGPRWFLRGLLNGPAATDPVQADRLLDAFRSTIVVRGIEAMAPRDMLPLRLPKEALAQAPPESEPARHTLEMLERGPEITETR